MGAGKGQSQATTTSSPNPQAMASYQNLLQQAGNVASTPYQPYTGTLTAGLTPEQNTATSEISNAQYAAQPWINAAGGYAAAGAAPITAGQIQNYSNPYQQQVVNATLGQMGNMDSQQQAQLEGQGLGAGGLFNDRLGVAQGTLAGQQDIANNSTLAGLNSQNYQQSLAAAQADRAASGQAAYTFGNLGNEDLSTILQGAGALNTQGQQSQATTQAGLSANYQQYLNQQAFPYQQLSWESGIDTGVGSNMGGTSTTVGTPAQPSPWNTIAGLGIAGAGLAMGNPGAALGGAGLIGHRRGGRIGFADGGVPGVPYASGSSYVPVVQITHGKGAPSPPSLPQQQQHPSAAAQGLGALGKSATGGTGSLGQSLGLSGPTYGGGNALTDAYGGSSSSPLDGLDPSDYGAGFARGGGIAGLLHHRRGGIFMPYRHRPGFAEGGSPDLGDIDDVPANIPGIAAPAPATLYDPSLGFGAAGAFSPLTPGIGIDQPPSPAASDAADSASGESTPVPMPQSRPDIAPALDQPVDVPAPPGGGSGSPVRGVAGIPQSYVEQVQKSEGFQPRASWDYKQYTNGYGTRARSPDEVISEPEAQRRFRDEFTRAAQVVDTVNPELDPGTRAALASLTFNTGDSWVNGKLGAAVRDGDMDAAREIFQQYNKAGGQPLGGLITRRQNEAGWFGRDAPPTGNDGADTPDNPTFGGLGAGTSGLRAAFTGATHDDSGNENKGLGAASPALSRALMSAGFALMASRSPWFGQAAGEAGLAGVGAYATEKQAETTNKLKQDQVQQQVRRLDQAADKADRELKIKEQQAATAKLKEEEYERRGQVPQGYRPNAKGDGIEPIPGGPQDPNVIRQKSEARTATGGLAPEAKEMKARQLIGGDLSGLTNIGRGAQGGRDLADISNTAAQILVKEQGLSPQAAAEKMTQAVQDFKARQIGVNTEARTTGVREANLNNILKVADAAIPAALEASDKVTRYGGPFVPVNQLVQKGQVMTSNPELAEFGMANLQLAEHWARAMNPTGVMRESDRDKALSFLSTATSADTYKRMVMQLQKQITRERDAISAHTASVGPNAPITDKPRDDIAPGGAAPSEGAPAAAPAASPPPRPAAVPSGSAYSPSRQMWRAPDGHMFNAQGQAVQ